MFIIVLGSGKTGSKVANVLSKKKLHDVVVVDIDEDSFRRLDEDFNGITVLGNGVNEEVLREAGMEKADVFLAVTDDQNANIMAAQVAKNIFNVLRVITKVQDTDINERFYSKTLNPIDTHRIIASKLIDNIITGPDIKT